MKSLGARSVYVIGSTSNPVKIGSADNAAKRLGELQIGCPDELIIHHNVRVPFYLAEPIEKATHAKLAAHHRRGEWFDVDAAMALLTILEVKRAHLAEHQREETLKGDLLDRLASIYPMRHNSRDAVCDYREAVDAGKSDVTGQANGYVLREAGELAYAAFSLVIAQRKPLRSLVGEDLIRAEGALAKSINALADFSAKFRAAKITAASLKAQASYAS